MSNVLAVVTSHPVYDGHDLPTGLWLSELTHFFDRLVKAGHSVDIASIAGGKVPIDPVSLEKMNMDAETRGYYEDPRFMKLLDESPALKDLNPAGYDAIYFAGGHGTMFDFRHQPEIEQAILTIDGRGGVVSAVCHGPAALLDVQKDGRPFIAGKKVTGFSLLEERLAFRKDKVPFILEEEMKKRSDGYDKALLPFVPHAVVDGRLVTGQNPLSAKAVAEKVIEVLRQGAN